MTPSEIKATGKPVAYSTHYTNTNGSQHPALQGYLLVTLTNRQETYVFQRRVRA